MKTAVTLKGSELKAIAYKTTTSIAAVNALASRERIRHESDITRMRSQLVRNGEKIVDTDFMQFFKDLEKSGVGSIVYGRRGKPTKFAWYYSLKAISKCMLEGTDVQVTKVNSALVDQSKTILRKDEGVKVVRYTDLEPKKVSIVLANGLTVEISADTKVSAAAADSVLNALRTMF